MDSTPSPNSAWLTIISSIAAAVGALLAKKRFTRKPPGSPASGHGSLVTLTEFHQVLDALRDKMDANQKELVSMLLTQGAAIEKRLDALESSVARLDERTKILCTFATTVEVPIHQATSPAIY
jgi:hypothetical protein